MIVLRRPRGEGIFHPSGIVALSGVRALGVPAQGARIIPALGWLQGPAFTTGLSTLDHTRPRAVEHRDCPPCGGDRGIIPQVEEGEDLYSGAVFVSFDLRGVLRRAAAELRVFPVGSLGGFPPSFAKRTGEVDR